jgi:hypothetical protein
MVYNEIWKGYLHTYREKNKDELNEYYRKKNADRYQNDSEYREKRLLQMRLYHERKRQEKIESGIIVNPRGRPRIIATET